MNETVISWHLRKQFRVITCLGIAPPASNEDKYRNEMSYTDKSSKKLLFFFFISKNKINIILYKISSQSNTEIYRVLIKFFLQLKKVITKVVDEISQPNLFYFNQGF